MRPFPEQDLKVAVKQAQAVAVFDQNISIGKGGVLYPEIAGALYQKRRGLSCCRLLEGLGGKPVCE